MNEMLVRALSGAIYVALVLLAAWLGPLATAVLFLPITFIAAREWHQLFWKNAEQPTPLSHTIALALVGYLSVVVVLIDPRLALGVLASLALCSLLILFQLLRSGSDDPSKAFAGHVTTVLYIAMPMAAAVLMVSLGTMVFIGFMCLLWTNDTGAYLIGKPFGKHKLMPAVSPGKSWEGFVGGMLLTMALAWFIGVHHRELPLKAWLIAGFAVSISATIGDLLESAMKRAAGVKDSGTIMPGHGGVLDRFDGYLLAAPVMVIIALMMRG